MDKYLNTLYMRQLIIPPTAIVDYMHIYKGVRYFPKGIFPSATSQMCNFSSGNFPNDNFPSGNFPMKEKLNFPHEGSIK